jgi:hypothetical protein
MEQFDIAFFIVDGRDDGITRMVAHRFIYSLIG